MWGAGPESAFISDMDGVIYHGPKLLPGVTEFVEWLQKEERPPHQEQAEEGELSKFMSTIDAALGENGKLPQTPVP